MPARQAPTFKVRVWAILGAAKAGKSTTIGYLISQLGSGGRPAAGGGGFKYVPLRGGGYLEIYPRRQSLQEANQSPEDVVTDIGRLSRGRVAWLNFLVAIRTDAFRGHPPAYEYLSYFARVGWTIESLVILDYDETNRTEEHASYYEFGAPTYELYEAKALSKNRRHHHWLVGQVRNHFGWA